MKGKQSNEQKMKAAGHNLYILFEDTIIMEHIHRQQGNDQALFHEELDHLSEGKFTIKDWGCWKHQSLDMPPQKRGHASSERQKWPVPTPKT